MSNQAYGQTYGWTGRHIRVNLTTTEIRVTENDPAVMKAFLGARGLGIRAVLIDRRNESPHDDCITVTRLKAVADLV